MKSTPDRPEFNAFDVSLMQCVPGNKWHGEGERCVILTIGIPDGSIEAQAYGLKDARQLATRLLVALAVYEDALADKILHEHFAADDEGQYVWPERSNDPE